MNEDAKQIIAFLLKRSGRTSLPESEFYLTMSMDLQWCSPKIAKEFVSQALQSGLLSKKEDDLSPSFDTKTVEIPTGFHPDLSSLSLKDESPSSDDLFDAVCDCISKHTKKSKESIADEIREEAQTKKLHESVAALMVAKRYERDIKPFLPQVKESMFTENTE